MEKPTYQRVLLKISGEALAGAPGRGIDFAFARQVCQVVQDCVRHGVQVGLVVGGGNFWRGVKDGGGRMERARADQMGMLATVINSLALQDVLEQLGQPARVLTSIPMGPVGRSIPSRRLTGTCGRGRWFSSPGAPATPISPPTRRRFSGRRRSRRT